MRLTDEQTDDLADKVALFRDTRPAKRSAFRRLSPTEKQERVHSIRLRGRLHGLNWLINRTLSAHHVLDPMLSLDDTVLLALDDTMDRAIGCQRSQVMFESDEARIVPSHGVFLFDANDPLDQKLMALSNVQNCDGIP